MTRAVPCRSSAPLLLCTLGLAALALGAAPASALPVVSVDVDPDTPGIQASRNVGPASSFEVDIVVDGIDTSTPLNGFEFDLLFDAAVLTATSVVDGGFLLAPVFVVQEDIGAVSVEFAEVTLGPFGATGGGVLATVGFDAVGLGSSDLDLENVVLSAPFGVRIPTDAIEDGVIVVGDETTPVIPEPASAVVFGVGCLLVGRRLRRRA